MLKERNNVIFEDECFSFSWLKSFFLRSFYSWASLIRRGGGGGGEEGLLYCKTSFLHSLARFLGW